ncbi:MAG: hypothetical protein ACLFOY_18310 [Desulfatibacillaceae bacterium]
MSRTFHISAKTGTHSLFELWGTWVAVFPEEADCSGCRAEEEPRALEDRDSRDCRQMTGPEGPLRRDKGNQTE